MLLQFDPNQFLSWASLVAQTVKTAYNSGCLGLIPESGRSPGKGNGYPLQFSGLGNSMDSIAHGVAKSQTRLSDFHFHYIVAHLKKIIMLRIHILFRMIVIISHTTLLF